MPFLSVSNSADTSPRQNKKNSFCPSQSRVIKNGLRLIALALTSTLTVTTESFFGQSASFSVHAATFPVITIQTLSSITINNPPNHQRRRNYHQDRNIPKGINVYKLSRISPQRRIHILDGDATGGGHRSGRGIPGKSEFPSRWNDRQVIKYISDIIKDPNSRWIRQPGKPPYRWRIEGTRDGINIRVIVEPQGQGVITAFPTNRPRNP